MDDEKHYIITLEKIFKINFPFINIVGTASNINDGVNLIKKHKPDLVFLDIEFSNEMGFDLFKHFNNKVDFNVIFISSHQEYAIKAIKYAAFDYILKPVDIKELNNALNRYLEKKNYQHTREESINLLLENFRTNNFKKIAFSTSKGIQITSIDSIVRCEADTSYCKIFLTNNEKITITKSLKDTEELLPPDCFLRVHKSHLVNINHIKVYSRKEGGIIYMSDNSEIYVSSRKKEALIAFLRKIPFNFND